MAYPELTCSPEAEKGRERIAAPAPLALLGAKAHRLGQGLALGEGFPAAQDCARELSRRVLARVLETALPTLLVEAARRRGISRLDGEFPPSGKNGVAGDRYEGLGFVGEYSGPAAAAASP